MPGQQPAPDTRGAPLDLVHRGEIALRACGVGRGLSVKGACYTEINPPHGLAGKESDVSIMIFLIRTTCPSSNQCRG